MPENLSKAFSRGKQAAKRGQPRETAYCHHELRREFFRGYDMKSTNVTNLTDQQLAVMANREHDPHALLKLSGARQRDAVLSICKEPAARPDNIHAAQYDVERLEKELEEAWRSHNRSFPGGQTFGARCVESQNAIGRINTALYMARGHVKDLEKAEAARAARNEPPSAA
jgi:hypothetical protein